MTPKLHAKQTLYAYRRWEAWLWVAVGLLATGVFQYSGSVRDGTTITWQRWSVSVVCGIVGGMIVWNVHFPLRWPLALALAYWFLSSNWKHLAGQRWEYDLSRNHFYLWMAAGVAGTYLYSRWLEWNYHDYPEGYTLYLCYWGSVLGAPILVLGMIRFVQQYLGKIQDQAAIAAQKENWEETVKTQLAEFRQRQREMRMNGDSTISLS